jgi:hypothetical protein
MSAIALLFSVVALAAACNKTVTVYQRTSPRRVEVTKQASPPALVVHAVRLPSGAIAIRLKHATQMRLSRVLHHNAVAMIYDHGGSVYNEVVEMFVGILMAPLPGAFWGMGDRIDGQDTPTRKTVRHRRLLLALLDPTTSVFTNNIRTEPIVTEQIFSDPPIVRDYEIRLPAPSTPVTYRILDASKRELASGAGATDLHGELLATDSLETAVAVELTSGGKVMIVPIESRAARVAMTDAPPPPPARHVASTLINEGWSKVRKHRRKLPRVTLAADLVYPLVFAGPMLRAEVRIHPKVSASAIVSRFEPTYLTNLDNEVTGTNTSAGGQLRFYLRDFARGIHFGVEAMYGQVDIELGSGTREVTQYGAFAGYKYAFDFGFTVDIQVGAQHERDADGDNVLGGDQMFGHLDVGWSF